MPSKLLVIFDEKHNKEAFGKFCAELGASASIVLGMYDWFLEVLNPEVNKGNGLAKMCQQLQIPLEECVSFGDGLNDVEFLQKSGLGFALKNARDMAKKVADEVIEYTNDEQGVRRTLERLEQEGKLRLDS